MDALNSISGGFRVKMRVGVISSAVNDDTGENIAEYAAANEFGRIVQTSDGAYFQLPRPAIRNTIAEKKGEWGDTLGALLRGGEQSADGVVSAINEAGKVMVQDIRNTIENSVPPPNAKSTVEAKRRKGRARPDQTLVDSGSFQRAIDYEVIPGGGE